MEPFSIACTTCQARLRVRDESVMGQILTCPKCGSMVLVEPPPTEPVETPTTAPTGESVSAAPAPASDFEEAANLFDPPPRPQPPQSKEASEFADTVEDISVQAAAPSAPPPRAFTEDRAEPEPSEDASPPAESQFEYDSASLPEQPLLPNADWTSPAATAWRNRALTVAAVVVGIVLALGASLLFNGSDSDPPAPPPSLETAQVDPAPADPTATTASDSIQDTERPDAESESASAAEATTEPKEPAAAESPVEPEAVPVDPEIQDGHGTDPPDGHAAESTSDTDEAASTAEETPNEVPGETPPGLTTAPEDPEASSAAPGSVAETLREFGELLGPPPAASSDMAEAEVDPEVTPDGDAIHADEALPRPGARVVDVDARLQDPIAAIEFKDIPLKNFLRFISDFSTIPVTLDADTLVWSKITPVTHITVTASESTVAEVLTEALAPLGLYYRIEREQLFVTRRPKNDTGLRTVKFKVADLVGDDAQELQRLGEMIMSLVEPDSWIQRGGSGTLNYEGTTLVMEQEEPVLFEVLAFCQKMRVASGLDIGGQYAPSIFRLDTRTARAQPKLAQPISLTYIRPASFQRIVDQISEVARLHVLIDWRTLAEADWSPDAEVAFATAGEPLSDALAKLLHPMDLTYRVVGESVLQITTQEAFDARLEVEFYRIGPLLEKNTAADLMQAIQGALGNDRFRELGGDGLLTVDPKRKCLLACVPQSQHIRLEKWLAEQEAVGAALGTTIPTAAGEFRIAPASDPGSSD